MIPTYEEMYEHLMLVRRIDRRIWIAQLERDNIQSCLLPSAITYDKDIVQSSPKDKMLDIAGRVIELEKKVERLKREKAGLIIRTHEEISLLQDEDQREILIAFFIGRQPMREIAANMDRSISGVYTIRRKGIQALRDLL